VLILSNFTVLQAMHYKKQEIGFGIERPGGTNFHIFIHFINPIDIVLDKTPIHTSSNACIIFTPFYPQYYYAVTHTMFNNFVHFKVNSPKRFQEFCLPVNQLFYTNMVDEITNAVETMSVNCILEKDDFENRHWDYQNIAEEALLHMFSCLHNERLSQRSPSGMFSTSNVFEELRQRIYSSPKDWNVSSMAKYVQLSYSQFTVRYKKLFNISPNADLINAALLLAERLLITTTMTILEIALECGFNSSEYFIRCFRRQKGITPGQYRDKISLH